MAHNRRNDFLIPTLAVLFDVAAIELSFILSYWLRFNTTLFEFLPLTEGMPPLRSYILGSMFIIPVWLLLFQSRKMYGARRNIDLTDELANIVKVVTIGMLVVMSVAFFYRAFSYSRIVFGLLWVVAIATVFSGRFLLHQIEKTLYRRGRELRNAVIIGRNATAERIFSILHQHPLLGYRMVGYFADTPSPALQELRYLGSFKEVPESLVNHDVELALISIDRDEHAELSEIVRECEGLSVEFMMVPDALELMTGGARMREIEGVPFITLKGVPMTTWGLILKRAFDLIVSGFLLLLASVPMLLTAIAIRLTSKGDVFYRQERVGLDGVRFAMLKFRSMRVDAEEDTGPVWASDHDRRRTRLGTLLRKTSIDELPQLFNVLKGDMSLVGPRPERPHFVNQFKTLIPKYLDRHRVKTGITGWAQVNGLRGNTSLEERVKYDLYYIENWSMWFDIKILFRTVRALFSVRHVH